MSIHLEGALAHAQRFPQPLSRNNLRRRMGPGNPLYHVLQQLAVEDIFVLKDDFEYLNASVWDSDDSQNCGGPWLATASDDSVCGQATLAAGGTDNEWGRLQTQSEMFNTDHRPAMLAHFNCDNFDQYIHTTDSTATVDGAINSSVVSIVTSDNTVFTAGTSVIYIGTEFMLVNTVDADAVTIGVTRGYAGSTAAAQSDGATIYLREDGDALKFEFGFAANLGTADNGAEAADAGMAATKATPASNVNNYGVVILDTDDNRYWDVMSDVGGTAATTNVTESDAWDGEDSVWQTVMVSLNEQDDVMGWINGHFIGVNRAGGPAGTNSLALHIFFQNRTNAAKAIALDYVYAWQERAAIA